MIILRDVIFKYDSDDTESIKIALNEINLEIREGEYVSFMGHNSSGKTTLARCLNALLIPDKGKVMVDDMVTSNFANIPTIRRKVGMVFQNPENQIVSTTVEREIAFGLENLGMNRKEMKKRVEWALEVTDIKELRYRAPYELSGGQQQRVAIAGVLAMQPKILILDEPTSFLDSLSAIKIFKIIKQLNKELNLTIVLINIGWI